MHFPLNCIKLFSFLTSEQKINKKTNLQSEQKNPSTFKSKKKLKMLNINIKQTQRW